MSCRLDISQSPFFGNKAPASKHLGHCHGRIARLGHSMPFGMIFLSAISAGDRGSDAEIESRQASTRRGFRRPPGREKCGRSGRRGRRGSPPERRDERQAGTSARQVSELSQKLCHEAAYLLIDMPSDGAKVAAADPQVDRNEKDADKHQLQAEGERSGMIDRPAPDFSEIARSFLKISLTGMS